MSWLSVGCKLLLCFYLQSPAEDVLLIYHSDIAVKMLDTNVHSNVKLLLHKNTFDKTGLVVLV